MFLNLKLVMITTVIVLAGGILYIGPRGESVSAVDRARTMNDEPKVTH